MNLKTIFIVWYPYARRAETLASELNGQVHFLYKTRLKGPLQTPLRYLAQVRDTWRILEQERPDAVLVQSPPIFAALVVALWCQWRGQTRPSGGGRVRYVIDCHTGTFYDSKWRWALPLLRLISHRATAILSSTMNPESLLRSWQVEGFFLADGIPTLSPPSGSRDWQGQARVGIIGSLGIDEPVAETFAAARLLPHVTFYMLGDPTKLHEDLLAQKPDNVILTGFLRGGDYTQLLQNMHGLAVLTKQPRDLSCAAYEAVAVGKPAVISEDSDNIHYFTRGFIYVQNTPEAIAAGMQKMLDEQERLIPKVIALRTELIAERQPKIEKLAALLRGKA
jgi:hypothetical protein